MNYSKFAYSIVLKLSLKPLDYIFLFSVTNIEVIKVICVGLQGIESVEISNEREIIEVTKVMEIIEVTVEDKKAIFRLQRFYRKKVQMLVGTYKNFPRSSETNKNSKYNLFILYRYLNNFHYLRNLGNLSLISNLYTLYTLQAYTYYLYYFNIGDRKKTNGFSESCNTI